jgi:DNA-directed RNA polymerase II subunit RPB2
MECIHKFLQEPHSLVNHHISSYNQFIDNIPHIIHKQNPREILKNKSGADFKQVCKMYVGGKKGNLFIKGQPFFIEQEERKVLYPNDARLRNATYAFSLHAKLVFSFIINGVEDPSLEIETKDHVFIGNFPIMVQSNLCYLNDMPPEVMFNMGECSRDPGGYFIIDGSEKTLICQEERAVNSICVIKNYNDNYYYRAELKSESEDESKLARVTAVQIRTKTDEHDQLNKDGFSLHEIVVELPNVRMPIPLFIVMRALGIISDKQIIQTCLLNSEEHLIPHFRESIYDSGNIYTQMMALEYISTFAKYQTISHVLYILSELTLAHIGETNFIDKAYFIGYMVKKLLLVGTTIEPKTDRDSFRFKRMNSSGDLLSHLFRDYYIKQLKHVQKSIDKLYNTNKKFYETTEGFCQLFLNYETFFEDRIAEYGIYKAFKGDWGATSYTKKVGVSQQLNRLSYNSMISHLRKCVLQMDSSAKIVAPHLLHATQWGVFDPVDSPDGGDIGLHKHLAICTQITDGFPMKIILDELKRLNVTITSFENSTPLELSRMVKLIINGTWHGCVYQPKEIVDLLRMRRRHGYIPPSTSLSWNIQENVVYIYTDAGRLQRPLFYVEDHVVSYNKDKDSHLTWKELITGTDKVPCKIEYVDADELNTSLVTFDSTLDFTKKENHHYTHVELHGSSLLGFMGNQIIFPEHNPLPRNCFSCSQSRQAVSMYHTNHQNRMDKMGVVLNYGQTPLIQSSFFEGFKSLPYGINAMVAIMCYTGYNTEDAILINRGALDRGIFNTSYFKTYEESETYNEDSDKMLVFQKGSNTDEYGLVKENTIVNEDTILMQMVQSGKIKNIYPKRDQVGRIDKTFISENKEGKRIAKVRICTERIPEIGDKFASRAGQKGTCGLIINEVDMPFTSEGLRPDLIINPHALPSRMTIGQLLESLIGKVHLNNGGLGDCSAFNTGDTSNYHLELKKMGYHSSGTELLHNGLTGDQIESKIFFGPTYYMRLKHMVSDKINYRPRGPNAALTRQPLQGRDKEGGLRIGEMERDGLVANGMSSFVQESMMVRGDGTMVVNNTRKPYKICVDNSSGLMAIHNEYTNLNISPSIDGVTFEGDKLSTIPKYNKTFSTLNVPYCFKLLMQELAVMNVQMRLITTDSLNHMESMNTLALESLLPSLFERLSTSIGSFMKNRLYVSRSDIGLQLSFQHKEMDPTLFPYLDSTKYRWIQYISRTISPQRKYTPMFNRDKFKLDIYKTDGTSMERTMDYFWNKMKTGIFVRIKNNKVFNFNPFYNVNYKNDFHEKFSKEQLDTLFKEIEKESKKRLSQMSTDPSTWNATNCLLRIEKEDDKHKASPTEQYLPEMYDMLVEACNHRKINDCFFFINRKDFPYLRKDWKETYFSIYGDAKMPDTFLNKPFIPVVSQTTSIHHADIPFPTGDDWNAIAEDTFFANAQRNYFQHTLATEYKNEHTLRNNLPEWEARKAEFVWRGQATGCGNTIETNPRMKLDSLTGTILHLDAHITRYTQRVKASQVDGKLNVDYKSYKRESVEAEKFKLPMKDQLHYKFIINVEGNSAAYRLGPLFGLGYCILNVESNYKLWFESMLKTMPYGAEGIETCHCITIKHDLSDLKDAIEWCLANDEICKKIQENAMDFYRKTFTRDFVYDYVADMCNSISTTLNSQENNYEEVKKLTPKPKLTFKTYTQDTSVSTSTSVIIVPYRDTGEQNRAEQLEKFLLHYKDRNVLIVEQTPGEKFNRGILLNIGYDYIVRNLPEITSFVFHDVDIINEPNIQDKYYGDDTKDIVHLGMLVKDDKYKSDATNTFLGRAIRFSKNAFKEINGFPNTFYGWGGEDDALRYRIMSSTLDATIYRPKEDANGYELETTNDIFVKRDPLLTEMHKIEETLSDTLTWKINGLNSLQYSIIENKMVSNAKKIVVQFTPFEQKLVKPPTQVLTPAPQEESLLEGGESLITSENKTKKISI